MAGFLVVIGRTENWGWGELSTEMGDRVSGRELDVRFGLCLIRNPTLLPWSVSVPYLIFPGYMQWSNSGEPPLPCALPTLPPQPPLSSFPLRQLGEAGLGAPSLRFSGPYQEVGGPQITVGSLKGQLLQFFLFLL